MTEAFDEEILGHYATGYEQDRLAAGRGELERLRTQEIISRHLPPQTAVVLDVGGAAGVYALWLASQGHEVHLIDPVPLHVEQATQASAIAEHALASVTQGDARMLEHADASADVVLLLGPLYHLTERDDRLRALREAKRVLRPSGLAFAVGITRFASLLDGLHADFIDDPVFGKIIEQDLRTGQHRNPEKVPGYFTTAYFHHPDELQAEVRESGLAVEETASIEGPPWWVVRDFARFWENPERREKMLAASRAVEHEASLLGLGPHIMVVARNA
jgi:ubiquinone/menaquinone biosynthesis C-methylase UbiE